MDCNTNTNCNGSLLVVFRCEHVVVLKVPEGLEVVSLGCEIESDEYQQPPTIVSCAPRKMAFGLKFEAARLFLSFSCCSADKRGF